MDKNKMIIIALIVVIFALVMAMFAMTYHTKEDTKLAITSNSTIYEGDSIGVKLMNMNGTPLSNQTINVTVIDENNSYSYYSIVTNSSGIGEFILNMSEGNYSINATFSGNENYSGNSTVKEITVKKVVVEVQNSSSNSNYYSSVDKDPEYGSDAYVDKWDESERGDGSWAFLHDQPVKTDEEGHNYKRMYDPDSGEGYWYQMN